MWFSVAVDPPTSGPNSTAWATPSSTASYSYTSLSLHNLGSARPFIVLLNGRWCDPRQQTPSYRRHRTQMRTTWFIERPNHQVPTTCATAAFMERLSQSKPSIILNKQKLELQQTNRRKPHQNWPFGSWKIWIYSWVMHFFHIFFPT